MDYKQAGVDVTAGYKSVELMKESVKSTFRPEVLTELGGFGGLFDISKAKNMEKPVLVSGTDGVGTKIKIAFLTDKHDTVGIDAVAMCVNDVVCSGAECLFFLDYIACGKNYPEKIAEIVKGVSEGCKMAGCSLIGGETAEHPGLMPEDEYDLAGFTVGILDSKNAIDGSKIKAGDVLIGIASSGIHSNGYSLVRKVLNPTKENINDFVPELGKTLGEALLTPTKIYVKQILDLISKVEVKGISHITGGGFIENIPRIMPEGTKAVIEEGSYPIPPIFTLIEEKGDIERMSMYNTFNMGIGMVVCVAPENCERAVKILEENGETAYKIGYVTEGSGIDIILK
ncbi:MAG: phosphoribosylformylglycinamidine cyclo-ligase [Clostridiales bacterium]|nr:phosphoribosylformylglycinamidine cyclo-ligase [Clostridiales bacterium]